MPSSSFIFTKYGMQDHRKPPKPAHYLTAGSGTCRQCGGDILKKDGSINKRASWHPKCVTEYRLVHFPNDTRRAVWKRDKGKCYICGTIVGRREWELEHIRPLIEAKGDLSFWQLPNCACVCIPCHQKKTAKEAGERAAARRALKPVVEKAVKKRVKKPKS
jgi:hypothetical protein